MLGGGEGGEDKAQISFCLIQSTFMTVFQMIFRSNPDKLTLEMMC